VSRPVRSVGTVLALLVVGLLVYLVGPGTDGPSSPAIPAASSGSAAQVSPGTRDRATGLPVVALGSLPVEAQQTVTLVDRGGPFPYRKDGAVFSNRERRLPAHPAGWYHEYTVVTPGSDDRGARRLITGDGGRQLFWTADHYLSFSLVRR
jgi:ribonuclease T1